MKQTIAWIALLNLCAAPGAHADWAARSATCSVNSPQSPQAASVPKATATITMNNDGGWCWYNSVATQSKTLLLVDAYVLSRPPVHGKVLLADSGKKSTRIAYKPDPGFTGTDTFEIHIMYLDHTRTYTVTVLP